MTKPKAPFSFRLLSIMPLPLLHLIGTLAGWLLYLLPNKQRDIAAINIERCFPELTPRQRRRLLRKSIVQAGRALAEGPLLWAGPKRRVERLLRDMVGYEQVVEALSRGKGVIVAAPHLGSWEMAGLAYSWLHPITSLYKPQKGAWDALIKQGRERFGAQLVPSEHGGVRQLLATLKRGETAGILPDQDPPEGSGVFADFFGIPAHTPVLMSRLARRTGATIIFMYAERLSWGRGFILHFESAPAEAYRDDDAQAAAGVNLGVETCVRRMPAQYWWPYARFRRRPASVQASGEDTDFYAGLAD